ncbi:MAG TPA: hypothetical protein VLT88_01830 [Desulfosarcina sp.]|nr:hypothetical protein [Desulfosarcina sp.]
MADDLEKRIAARRSTEGSITLYSSIGAYKEINGHLLNISEQGISFTTDTRLVPGTTILFKASNDSFPCADKGEAWQLRTISLVTVKWCHQGSSTDRSLYVVGATYTAPY